MTASTEIGIDHLVALSNGRLIEATSSTAPSDIVGVLRQEIASTDDDYATASRLVPVEVPVEKNVEWDCDVTSGLTASSVGLYYDITDGDHINTGASTYDVVLCVGYISATKGRFILNIGADARAKA